MMGKPLFQNIVVAINGSDSSIRAAQYAILISKQYKCAVKAVYVVDSATLKQLTMNKFFVPEEMNDYISNLAADGKRYLEYVSELARTKGVKIETELRNGSISTEIIAAASESKAQLILIGASTTSREISNTPIKGHHAADISNQKIIAAAPCSVLVVREHMIEQLFKMA
jgi:nucleotide-binding universal stress UspA family protein